MDHTDHVALLRGGVPTEPGTWADLGAGTGAFTLALADLLGPGAVIYAVDWDRVALRRLERERHARFPATTLHVIEADFSQPLPLPPLDGIVLANSLHFVRDKEPVLGLVRGYLRPGGRLLLVEYDTDRGNPWVPYPLAYPTWAALAARCGFSGTRLLATRPSRFLGRIYAAASERAAGVASGRIG
ncbi:MAG: class I SAM-dependent methyltransferase [Sphaerobacter sp.]|nr:class I SAM-dependent methyltransferase [Sphaerobacter sp.]